MEFDFWAMVERLIASRKDAQLLADWSAVKDRARVSGDRLQMVMFWNRLRDGSYYRERRAAAAGTAQPRRHVRRVTPLDPVEYPIGRSVAAERVRARLKQAELAEKIGVSREALARVERSARPLTFDEACRIADLLGISLEHLRAR